MSALCSLSCALLRCFDPPPLPGAALFLRPAVALMAGQGPGQIPEPWAADVLIRRPGHDVLVAEQPPEELQFRVAVLL